MWLAASDPGGAAGLAGLAVAAAGFGPSIALQRLLIAESAEVLDTPRRAWPDRDAEGNEARFVLFSWYWTALNLGVLGVFLASMIQPVGIVAVLRGAGVAAAVGGVLTLLRPLPCADPGAGGVAIAGAPWSRRAAGAAFGFRRAVRRDRRIGARSPAGASAGPIIRGRTGGAAAAIICRSFWGRRAMSASCWGIARI